MDSLTLSLVLNAAEARLVRRRVTSVWRSRRTDLFLNFDAEAGGLYLSFSDPVAVCLQAYPKRLLRVSDAEAAVVGEAVVGCDLVRLERSVGERTFALVFGCGEAGGESVLRVSLVPARAGVLVKRGGAVSGRESLKTLFDRPSPHTAGELLGDLAAAPLLRARLLLTGERARSLPLRFLNEALSAVRDATQWEALRSRIGDLLNGRGAPAIYRVRSELPEFLWKPHLAAFPYATLGEGRRFNEVEPAAAFFVGLARRVADDTTLYRGLLQRCSQELKRLLQTEESLAEDQERSSRADLYQRYGEALITLPEPVRQGPVHACWYDDAGEHPIEVPLLEDGADSRRSAQRYFDMARKARRAVAFIRQRREALAIRREETLRLRSALSAVASPDDLHSLARHLPGTMKGTAGAARKAGARKPCLEFECDDGMILVGRTAAENMVVTFKLAGPNDLFLHAHDVPGSHVIVQLRSGVREPGRASILRAAAIAAHFSKSRQDTHVEVCYTQRKFVRKIKGGILGQVRLERFKTIVVKPAGPGSEEQPLPDARAGKRPA